MLDTTELDTTKEEASVNGHDSEWLEFDDDNALLKYINDQKPAEQIVPIPEWKIKILCRELDPKSRIKIQLMAWDAETKLTDFRKPEVFVQIVLTGCYNPRTGRHFFTDSQRKSLTNEEKYGRVVELLALTVLRISAMIGGESSIKKN